MKNFRILLASIAAAVAISAAGFTAYATAPEAKPCCACCPAGECCCGDKCECDTGNCACTADCCATPCEVKEEKACCAK